MGISPTAFAKYLSRHAHKSERENPFILYADIQEDIAVQQAAEISKLWRVPISSISFKDLKKLSGRKNSVHYKILVNHVMCDYARTLLPENPSAFIPVEVRYSTETIRRIVKIKPNSTVKLLLLPHPSHRVQFMTAQTRKLIKSNGVIITPVTIRNFKALIKLLESGKYDYCILGPALRGNLPEEFQENPRIIPMDPRFDPESLESARIRSGVII